MASELAAKKMLLALDGIRARERDGRLEIQGLRLTDGERPQTSSYMQTVARLHRLRLEYDVKEPRSKRPITIVIQ